MGFREAIGQVSQEPADSAERQLYKGGMADDPIPRDVRDFILRYIDSIAQLEALLLLRRSKTVASTAESVARQLYIHEPEAAELLARLTADGLTTTSDGAFRYEPSSDEQRDLVDRLADLYGRQLIPVTNLIHAKSRRIREFADAFKLRKDQ